ncbi:MAG: GtrA family protein, partial [Akkermansia sp.]
MRHPAIKSLFTSFCKYLLAGGMAFVVDFATLFLCRDLLGLHYLLAAALGFIVGLVAVYIASNKWVFDRRRMKEKKTLEFSIFALI